MKTVYYYRTTDSAVLAGHLADTLDSARIEGMGFAFAQQFGAEARFTVEFLPRFAGVAFSKESPCLTPKLWAESKGGLWYPKDPATVRGKNPDAASGEAVKLCRLFTKTWPSEASKVRTSHLLRAFGLPAEPTEGEAASYFETGGAGYFASTLPVTAPEICAGEFVAAQAVFAKHESKA